MEASVTLQTRAQVERVRRDIDEARGRASAVRERAARATPESDQRPFSRARPFEEAPCLD